MSENKGIVFTISKGETKMDMNNFHGVGCKEMAEGFKSLGAVTKEVLKNEFHETEHSHVRLTENA